MTKDEALKLAMDWYGSGNQDPDEFEQLISSIVAQPEQKPTTKAGELRAMKTELWKQPEQDGECKYCTDGCTACDARKLPEQPKVRTGNCLRVSVCASEGHKIAPQRQWVGLTHEELEASKPTRSNDAVVWELAVEWAEAKLKELNS